MKIKGHAKIELINTKTGEVKVQEQDNTVTEFSKEVFQNLGYLVKPVANNYVYLPTGYYGPSNAISDLFGGILLFDSQILQNYDDTKKYNTPIYVPAGVEMVGNGSTLLTTYSGSNFYLGLYDASNSETSENTNNNKRTFIYEWAEDFAIGSINSICLTSALGGFIGTGQPITYNANNQRWEAQYELKRSQYWPPLAPHSTLFSLRGYSNGLSNQYLNSSGSYSDRRVDNISTFFYLNTEIQHKAITAEIESSSLLCLKDLPVDCFHNGIITLQKISLPIKKIDPFIKTSNVDTNKIIEETTLNLHQLDNSFPAGGINNITYARVTGGIGYILLVGTTSTAKAGNYGGRITNGSDIHVVKLYKGPNGQWACRYISYNNVSGFYSAGSGSNVVGLALGSPEDPAGIGVPFFEALLLDNDFIPSTNPYRDSLIIATSTDLTGSVGNTPKHYCYIVKPNGVASFYSYDSTTNTNINSVYLPNTNHYVSVGVYNAHFKDSLVNQSGRIRMPDFTYWDPVNDKHYISNSDELSGWSWSAGGHYHNTFDGYNYISEIGGQQTPSNNDSIGFSPLSGRHLDCNWLSTISNLDSPIVKGPTDKLRITYTLTFEEEEET